MDEEEARPIHAAVVTTIDDEASVRRAVNLLVAQKVVEILAPLVLSRVVDRILRARRGSHAVALTTDPARLTVATEAPLGLLVPAAGDGWWSARTSLALWTPEVIAAASVQNHTAPAPAAKSQAATGGAGAERKKKLLPAAKTD